MRSVAGSFKAAAVAYLVACDASAVAMLHRDSSLRSARMTPRCRPTAWPGQHGARQHSARARTGDRRGRAAAGDFAMNWQVAEAALFHGGGSSGYCEDEMEKEMAAYAEHLRRRKTEAKEEGEHADDSAAMAAEHRSMRERERQAGLARVEAERKENQESTSLVGQQFGLPPELSEASRPTPAPSPGPRRPSPALSL